MESPQLWCSSCSSCSSHVPPYHLTSGYEMAEGTSGRYFWVPDPLDGAGRWCIIGLPSHLTVCALQQGRSNINSVSSSRWRPLPPPLQWRHISEGSDFDLREAQEMRPRGGVGIESAHTASSIPLVLDQAADALWRGLVISTRLLVASLCVLRATPRILWPTP